MTVRVRVLEEEIAYTGKELRSGWAGTHADGAGDVAVGFIGRCRVENEDLVDLDDARAGTFIAANRMAHVIAEHSCNIETAVLRQRLLVAMLCERLGERDLTVRREGDDVYFDGRKLTVSIAAPSAGSSLIHLGINIDPTGAPVPAVGLEEMGVEPRQLLRELLASYAAEMASCRYAEGKVRTVP